MIALLRGNLFQKSQETLVLEVSGVGYELWCSQNSLQDFELQTELLAYVYTHVREDLIQLFGFSTELEKSVFLSLIKVNGVGPKMALAILSAAPVNALLSYIEQGDVKALSQLPKIGKKKAEQMILTLKGQLKFVQEEKALSSTHGEIKSALVNLGFKPADVDKVVTGMDPHMDLQAGIRQGLSVLGAQI